MLKFNKLYNLIMEELRSGPVSLFYFPKSKLKGLEIVYSKKHLTDRDYERGLSFNFGESFAYKCFDEICLRAYTKFKNLNNIKICGLLKVDETHFYKLIVYFYSNQKILLKNEIEITLNDFEKLKDLEFFNEVKYTNDKNYLISLDLTKEKL